MYFPYFNYHLIFLEPMVMIVLILHLNSFFSFVLIKTWVRNSQRKTLQNNIVFTIYSIYIIILYIFLVVYVDWRA